MSDHTMKKLTDFVKTIVKLAELARISKADDNIRWAKVMRDLNEISVPINPAVLYGRLAK